MCGGVPVIFSSRLHRPIRQVIVDPLGGVDYTLYRNKLPFFRRLLCTCCETSYDFLNEPHEDGNNTIMCLECRHIVGAIQQLMNSFSSFTIAVRHSPLSL